MRRLRWAPIFALAVLLPGCGGGGASTTRTVLVDYNLDEYATSYLGYFPRDITVHPGDSIDFRQAWTGEPHTVTAGKSTEEMGRLIAPYINGKQLPSEEPPEFVDADRRAPNFYSDGGLNQTGAQPCYLTDEPLRSDGKACTPAQHRQPAFTGRQNLYNSGFIHYEGNVGNHFRMPIADDATPGTYFYFCLVHGPPMSGNITIVPKDQPTPSQSQVTASAREELDKATIDVRAEHRDWSRFKSPDADIVTDNGSGPMSLPVAFPNEFYPSTFHAHVNQKVTWATGDHVVAFHVPRYGAQVSIGSDGTVTFNKKFYEAQGGPGYPSEPPADGSPARVDAGKYDGSFYLSSGVPDGPMLYSITFTKSGTYKYACTIHPRMIGTVVVS